MVAGSLHGLSCTRSQHILFSMTSHSNALDEIDKQAVAPNPDEALDAKSPSEGSDRQFVTALARGLEVLRCFRSGEERLGNQQLAERCRLPKSTVTRLTYTLTKIGYLHHDQASGRYRLGMAALGIGGSTLARLEVKEKSRSVLQAVAESTGLQLSLGVRDDLSMLYVDTCHGNSIVTLQLNVGSRIPISVTAMGRACLAGMDEVSRRDILVRIRALDPVKWPKIKTGIQQAIVDLAEHGCCVSFSEWRTEVHGIGIPLSLGSALPDMVVTAAGPAMTRTRESYMTEVRPLLISAVQDIKRRLSD